MIGKPANVTKVSSILRSKIFFYLSICYLLAAAYLFRSAQPWKYRFLFSSLDASSGGEVLPLEVQEMATLLDRLQLDRFNLAEDLASNGLIFQRTLEYLYPRRLVDSKSILFTTESKLFAHKCKELAKATKIYAYECHK